MQKKLFLDFDGVLHALPGYVPRSWQEIIQNPDFFVPQLVGRVLRIVRETGCEIVVTSAWRLDFTIDQFNLIFEGAVTAVTPVIHRPIAESQVRYREVQSYLENEVSGRARWIAIDDQAKHYPKKHNIIITDPQRGIAEQQADHCIELLGTKLVDG